LTSDKRLKKGITDVNYEQVDAIFDKLQVRNFRWNDLALSHPRYKDDDFLQIGLIAQEVELVQQNLVITREKNHPINEDFGFTCKSEKDCFCWNDEQDHQKTGLKEIKTDKLLMLCIAQIKNLKNRILELEINLLSSNI